MYKASRTEEAFCRRTGDAEAPRGAQAKRGAYPKSIRTKWRMQKWRQSYRASRQEKKEEAVSTEEDVGGKSAKRGS